MRNLKKVLALVLAVAMFASMAMVASAASYSDVASTATYADAVNLLSNLGIITGYEDGTFKPENTVTRAEAATMMVRMLGLSDDVVKGDTIFTDVDANHWASGYINVAVNAGIINGMGDGTFAPEAPVTYGQIVKMIVCALGYEPVAAGNGGWANGGYLVAGSKAGFTKGVNGSMDSAASRATVAMLMYKALEVELMEQDSYSTGIMGDVFRVQENKTILSEYLELEKVEAVVTETYLSSAEYEEGDNEVELVITKTFVDEDEEDVLYEVADVESFVAEGTDAATLLGYSVVAYVGENEDGDNAIFAISAKAGKNTKLVLDTELVKTFGEITDEDGDVVYDFGIEYYKSETAKSTTKAEIQNYVEIKNNDVEDIANMVVNGFNADYVHTAAIVDEFESLEEITLLDNDNDGDFEFVFATIPTNAVEFVVTEVESEDDLWTIEGENKDGDEDFDIDYADEDKIFTVVKDGKIVDAAAIAEGDVVTILDDSVNVITVNVSSVVVDAMVDEVDGDVYTIGGADYKLSPVAMADEELEAGDEGLFYINAVGKIAFVDTKSTVAGADYVYVIDADLSEGDFGDNEYLVKVVTAAGEIEVLTIKSKKVDIYLPMVEDEDGDLVEDVVEDLTDEEAFDYLEEYVGIARIDTTAAGEISTIYFPGSEDAFLENERYAEDNEVEYKEARGTYGSVDLVAETLVFHYDTTEEDLEDAITVTTVGNLFVDGSSYVFTAYGEEDEAAEVIVAVDARTALDSEAPVMVVTKKSKVTSDDETTLKITGVVAGATVSVIVDPDEYDYDAVEVGNVILYAESGDYVTDVEVLYTSTEDGLGDLAADAEDILDGEYSDEYVTIHVGELTDKTAKFVEVDDVDKYYFAEEVNVIVVDYTIGGKMSVKAGDLGDVKTSSRYEKTVFLKTVAEEEDVVSDIVVFIAD